MRKRICIVACFLGCQITNLLAQDFARMWPTSGTMIECESTTVCNTQWTFRGMKGVGVSLNGAQSTLAVTTTGPDDFVIERKDTAGPSVGLAARYYGHVTGNVVEGDVELNWPGHLDGKPSHGHWFASENGQDLSVVIGRSKGRSGVGVHVGGIAAGIRAGDTPDRFPLEGRTIIHTGPKPASMLGLAVDTTGNAIVASYLGKRIVRMDGTGHALTVAGGGKDGVSADELKSTVATGYGFFDGPKGIGVDGADNVYTADFQELRKLSLRTGRISNLPVVVHQVPIVLGADGVGNVYFSDTEGIHKYSAREDSVGSVAPGMLLKGIIGDDAGRFAVSQSGIVFYIDGGQLKEVRSGVIRTIPGTAGRGQSPSAIGNASGLAASTDGDLYFMRDQKLWKLQHETDAVSLISTVPESCSSGQLAAGGPGVLYAFCTGYVQRIALQ